MTHPCPPEEGSTPLSRQAVSPCGEQLTRVSIRVDARPATRMMEGRYQTYARFGTRQSSSVHGEHPMKTLVVAYPFSAPCFSAGS
jgi:hypothetical protein